MGADGGSIAKRSELVKTVKSSNPVDLTGYADLWTQCSLSHQKLQDPVVSDWNGNLYNKKAVLELLLGTFDQAVSNHCEISQIRDIVELHRELDERGNWIDQLTRKNFAQEGMSERFAYLAECGHIGPAGVLARNTHCPICETPYTDTVVLNPQSTSGRQHNRRRREHLDSLGLSNSLRPTKKTTSNKRTSGFGDSVVKKNKTVKHS